MASGNCDVSSIYVRFLRKQSGLDQLFGQIECCVVHLKVFQTLQQLDSSGDGIGIAFGCFRVN